MVSKFLGFFSARSTFPILIVCLFWSAILQAQDEVKEEVQVAPALSEDSLEKRFGHRIPRDNQSEYVYQNGLYKLRIGAARPSFPFQEEYNKYYGAPSWMPSLAADWFFYRYYLTFGWHMGLGYYKARGKAAIQQEDKSIKPDDNSPVDFSLFPVWTGLTMQINPFQQRWVQLSGNFSYVYEMTQEMRYLDQVDAEGEEKPYRTFGRNHALRTTVYVDFLLNPLDRSTTATLGIMDLHAVYLSPFYVVQTKLRGFGLDPTRTEMGLMFSFETRN